ncbi:MAG: MFS transporter, partial [Pseudomonadota bacterium]|nr:MFS transporter [Pseudomonadota bacterium]
MRSDPLAGGERPISRAAEGRRIGERELIGMMALLMACNAFGIDAILPALDDLAGSLGAQGNDRQFVVGIYLLAGGIGTLIPGAFADRYGRRPVLFTALGFYIAFSLACALVTSFTQLIVLRALQGFFAAGIIALPPAIIRDRVGGDKMARMMSLIFVIFLLVPAVAPS